MTASVLLDEPNIGLKMKFVFKRMQWMDGWQCVLGIAWGQKAADELSGSLARVCPKHMGVMEDESEPFILNAFSLNTMSSFFIIIGVDHAIKFEKIFNNVMNTNLCITNLMLSYFESHVGAFILAEK